MSVAELVCQSNYAFLYGASTPHELVEAAADLGLSHVGLVDRDGVYGVVEAHNAAIDAGIHLVVGATITVAQHPPLILLAQDHTGWSNLCNLLTNARDPMPKGWAVSSIEQVASHSKGLTAIARYGWTLDELDPLIQAFDDRLEVLLTRQDVPADRERLAWAQRLSRALGRPPVASNDVAFHSPERRNLFDVVTCIRRRTTLDAAGRILARNKARHLLGPDAFRTRYGDWPEAIRQSTAVAERCTFTVKELNYSYPREVVPQGKTPMTWLTELTHEGLAARYPEGVPSNVIQQVDHELALVDRMEFPSYFLTVYDIVRFARERGILCQGRGSAANSAVCYALGITEVDPSRSSLLFERFISEERGEPPDIDVDFEHERREEVIQYIYNRYGRRRAGMVNEIIAYRGRSAVRDVGKVFGLSLDQVDRLAKIHSRWVHGSPASTDQLVREVGLDPTDYAVTQTLRYSSEIRGFPRHVGIHVGGFVIAADRLSDLVPIEPASMTDRTVVQWDKYSVEDLNFVKVDVLALGILTCIRKAFDLIAVHTGERWTMSTLPAEDPVVYDMFCKGDTVGVFQIESRAQMSMLPRLKPRRFYDLVIEVAIVRPGPIQGGMVHPYLLRRSGAEPITYAHPLLEPILERTLGIPLFQEQVMAMAVAVGGFTPGEADHLRRAMGAWRKRGKLDVIGQKLVNGMLERGITPEYAEAIYKQIQGFGEYGFPESHSASFALLVYVSGWLKCHQPAVFAASLINSQPMGFYSPRAIVEDARRHGVQVRPVCVVQSDWDCTIEKTDAGELVLRLGFRLIRSIGEEHANQLVTARQNRPFNDLADLARRSGLDKGRLTTLADANALEALVPERRQASWILQGLWLDLPLFAGIPERGKSPPQSLPTPTAVEELQADYRTTGLSLSHHPVVMARNRLVKGGQQLEPLIRLFQQPSGSRVQIAGLISNRQRPGTASGVVFMTLEDETTMVNVIVWPGVWEQFRLLAATAVLIGIDGRLQREGEAISVVANRFWAVEDRPMVEVRARNFR